MTTPSIFFVASSNSKELSVTVEGPCQQQMKVGTTNASLSESAPTTKSLHDSVSPLEPQTTEPSTDSDEDDVLFNDENDPDCFDYGLLDQSDDELFNPKARAIPRPFAPIDFKSVNSPKNFMEHSRKPKVAFAPSGLPVGTSKDVLESHPKNVGTTSTPKTAKAIDNKDSPALLTEHEEAKWTNDRRPVRAAA